MMSSRSARLEAGETAEAIREFEERRRYRIVPILSPRKSLCGSAQPETGSLADVRAATELMKRVGVSGIQKTSITHREFLINGVAFRNYPCVPVRLSPPQSFAKTIVELRRNPFTCELRRRTPIDIFSSTAASVSLDAIADWTGSWAKRCTKEKGVPYRSQGSMGNTPHGFTAFFLGYFADKCVCYEKNATEWYMLACDGLLEQLPFEVLACKLALVLCSSRTKCDDFISIYFSVVQHLVLSRVRSLTVQDVVALIATCETLLELNDISPTQRADKGGETAAAAAVPSLIRRLKDEAAMLSEWQGTRLELTVQEMMQGISTRCPLLSGLLQGQEAASLGREALEMLLDNLPGASATTQSSPMAQSGSF